MATAIAQAKESVPSAAKAKPRYIIQSHTQSFDYCFAYPSYSVAWGRFIVCVIVLRVFYCKTHPKWIIFGRGMKLVIRAGQKLFLTRIYTITLCQKVIFKCFEYLCVIVLSDAGRTYTSGVACGSRGEIASSTSLYMKDVAVLTLCMHGLAGCAVATLLLTDAASRTFLV
eukprot:4933670-Amphidinium_carterae.1